MATSAADDISSYVVMIHVVVYQVHVWNVQECPVLLNLILLVFLATHPPSVSIDGAGPTKYQMGDQLIAMATCWWWVSYQGKFPLKQAGVK